MKRDLYLVNSLSRKKELFEPLHAPFVGMYVCGPTVYGYAHLGHAKSYISFDVIYRYLLHLGYQVRYVQNITDVGHLTDDADEGEDKIANQSRLEKKDPMQVVEHYMWAYYRDMDVLNVKRPDIAPRPSAHIPEQIETIQGLIEKGWAYEVNGSVYFDVMKFSRDHDYGKLSGRKMDDQLEGGAARTLEKQSEKRHPFDFALWKRANENHLMKWKSPWGEGYPGWHIECSVMSQKYLGETLDIHGGGTENMFPHHECEIAQSEAYTGKQFVKYWLHNNMVTLNGQKMGKSLGNSIYCYELFDGSNKLLSQPFSPMTVRFFILQSHYRSTLDFSDEALQAAEKGYRRLMNARKILKNLSLPEGSPAKDEKEDGSVLALLEDLYAAMSDDFNSAQVIAVLFELAGNVQSFHRNIKPLNSISQKTLSDLKEKFELFSGEILGLTDDEQTDNKLEGVMNVLIGLRQEARQKKDFLLSDQIRDRLLQEGIELKDEKDGTTWNTINN